MNNFKLRLISWIISSFMLISIFKTNVYAADNQSSTNDNNFPVVTNSEVTTRASANLSTNPNVTPNVTITTGAGATVGETPVDTQKPTVPTNLVASSVTSTSCKLSWAVSTDNVGVAGYDIYNGATKIGSTTGETTFEVTGLTANTQYGFTVAAKDSAGNVSEASSSLSVTTNAGTEVPTSIEDTQKPTVPTNLAASSVTSASCMLSWTASTDNVGVTGYDIYNGTTKIGSTTGETTFEVTGLTANTKYGFTVAAKDSAGNVSEASNALSVTTSAGTEVPINTTDTQKPTVPTNLVASSVTSASCILSWAASTDNVGVAGYDIYNGATKIGSTTGETTFEVTGLTANTQYSFTVTAKDAAGNASQASSALSVTTSKLADTQAPTVPTNLAVSSVTSTGCTLSWTASTDNVGVTGYDIYNGATKIGSTTGETTFEVTGLTANTSYNFTVVAKDAAANVSNASSALAVKTAQSSNTINSGLKLTQDTTYEDLTITGGLLDLNGHKLTINGNLAQTRGTICINGGQLIVAGDYTISGTSCLQMNKNEDYISVGGNFLMNSDLSNNLTAGTLEIKGNFTQKGTNMPNFEASGTHKVILDGVGDQTVSFDSPNSYFNVLDCSKAAGVTVATVIRTPTNILGTENIRSVITLLGSLKLTNDTNFNNKGGVIFTSGLLDLNGHKLTVNGNLAETGGIICINGGQLIVAGDYTISGTSFLQMNKNEDYIRVGGNFLMNSSYSNYLTAGTLEIRGNFTQKGTYMSNFVASGTHTVILYGTASFESTFSHFNKLIRMNLAVEGITLSSTSLNLKIGDTSKLIATVLPDTAVNKSVTWSSSDTNVATVDSDGLVTAVGNGKATIRCAANDGSGKGVICNVIVSDGTSNPETINISMDVNTCTIEVADGNNASYTIEVPDELYDPTKDSGFANTSKAVLAKATLEWYNADTQEEKDSILDDIRELRKCISEHNVSEWTEKFLADTINENIGGLVGIYTDQLTGLTEVEELNKQVYYTKYANTMRVIMSTTTNALNMGNKVHYDQLNGGTGDWLPTEIQNMYSETTFNFPRRGQRGADVEYISGPHPSEYEINPMNWPEGFNYGDFKPNTGSGYATFLRDMNSGKLPNDTVFLPYDPVSGELKVPVVELE